MCSLWLLLPGPFGSAPGQMGWWPSAVTLHLHDRVRVWGAEIFGLPGVAKNLSN